MLVTSTNLDIYETDVRLYVGDLDGLVYSDEVIYTALVNAVYYLSKRWFNKYLIYTSNILSGNPAPTGFINVNTPDGQCTIADTIQENDVFRNCYFSFTGGNPPIVEQQDVPALVLAASYLLRRSSASSSYTGLSWSTPDLSFSNTQLSKALLNFVEQDLKALDLFFAVKLGKIQIGYPKGNFEQIYPSVVDQVNYYIQMSRQTRYNK